LCNLPTGYSQVWADCRTKALAPAVDITDSHRSRSPENPMTTPPTSLPVPGPAGYGDLMADRMGISGIAVGYRPREEMGRVSAGWPIFKQAQAAVDIHVSGWLM
jgi:hypothetical protein